MRPDDLLRAAQARRGLRIRPLHEGQLGNGFIELTPSDCDDAAGASNVLFFWREWHRVVGFSTRFVGQAASGRIERQDVALLGILRGSPALDDVQTQVQRGAAKK